MKKKPLVIFGSGNIAELAHYYFSSDSEYEVVGFTIDKEYINNNHFKNLPVVPFENILSTFPPDRCDFFVALSYAKLNSVRKEKYENAKKMGYKLATYISSKSTCLTELPIGENCFILEDNTIQPFVSIGNNITIWSGNHIGHHSIIRDHTFLASHVVVSGGVDIGEQCFLGVNATLRDHIYIGARCVIGAGALILSDADPDGIYVGSPTDRSRIPSHRLKKI